MMLGEYTKLFGESIKKLDKILEKEADDIMAEILVLVGKRTAYDTGTSRKLIQDLLRKDLNRNDLAESLQEHVYEQWNTVAERASDGGTSRLTRDGNFGYDVDIQDDGFVLQEYQDDGNNRPSIYHRRGIDPNLVGEQIEFTMDRINADEEVSVKLAFDKLINRLKDVLEGK